MIIVKLHYKFLKCKKYLVSNEILSLVKNQKPCPVGFQQLGWEIITVDPGKIYRKYGKQNA